MISGLGVVAANGTGLEQFWATLVEPRPALAEATRFPGSGIIVGELSCDAPLRKLPNVRSAFCDRSALMAVAGATMAIDDARLDLSTISADRVGVILGNGAGGQLSLEEQFENFYRYQQSRPSPLSVSKFMPSSSASWVSMALGLKGPTFVVTSACASGTHAIGVGAQFIRGGLADVVLVGGAESCLNHATLRAWSSMGILAPDCCRPFSLGRRGLILSEGAGVLVLESEAHLKARGGRADLELAGFGFSADAGELTAPSDEGMARAMKLALADAGLHSDDVDYVNAHGTGTRSNDRAEALAIAYVFGNRPPPVSSTKAVHGHALGATGGIEAVAVALALRHGVIPPTANFDRADPDCVLDCVPNQARKARLHVALSNSFAFGGLNACIAVKHLDH